MAKRQASLAEWCGPRKKGRESSETESDATSTLDLGVGDSQVNPATAEPSAVSGETETDGKESDEGAIPVSICTVYVAQAVTRPISHLTSRFFSVSFQRKKLPTTMV